MVAVTNVYAWPPVANVAAEWSQVAPIGVSRSLLTGAQFVSAAQRRRRVARLDVSALSLDRNAAGYLEVLKRLLDGGVHLVRLWSTPITWHLDDEADNARRSRPMSWIMPPEGLPWSMPPGALDWWTGPGRTVATATTGTVLRIEGLPPLAQVARPGEFVTVGGQTAMILRPASADAEGRADLHLVTPITATGDALIGVRETAVFAADEMPRWVQPTGDNWTISWSFTEVHPDERAPWVEVDPWR
ncbi:hypothetical protein ACEYYA_00950 [Paracoccus sp. p3-h83]|uniref:hypothetical protein n=1 Tax=Paracoccus sp. p3-h83 TaxID=3342805 RepID=UPI0035BB4341